jgi:tRNA A-37 threonylcarbamoyl transferase component Bud32
MQLSRFKSDRYVGYVDPRYDGAELRALLAEPDSVCAMGAELVGERPGRVVYRLEIDTPRGRQQIYTQKLVNGRAVDAIRVPQAYTMLRTSRRMLACGLPTSRAIAAVRPRGVPVNRTSYCVTLAIRDSVPLSSLEPGEFAGRLGGFRKSQLIRQVASATAWMHLHGFYHRDLIAQNILIAHKHATITVWFVGLGRAGRADWMPPYVRQLRWAADLKALMRSEVQAFNERDRAVFLETYLRALGRSPGVGLIRRILARVQSPSKETE